MISRDFGIILDATIRDAGERRHEYLTEEVQERLRDVKRELRG